MRTRAGFTLIELFFAILVGFVVLYSAAGLLVGARRGEYRTNQAVDAAEEVGCAAGWIIRDLQALDHAPGEIPVRAEAEETAMRFHTRDGDRITQIAYTFNAATGDLTRTLSTGETRSFALGKGASVIFRPVDPSFAGGGAVALGQFNNRLVYRLTARRDGPMGARSYTLVGAVPYVVKASRDTFRFWNRPAPPPQA